MRLKKDLGELNASGKLQFGYVDITMYNCPPFVMFTNHNDCGICGCELQGKVNEPESMYLWSNLIALATYVFDIGTRCGEYSLVAAALRQDIPIISCEPNPDGFARLLINMLANDVKNIMPKRVAIANSEGFAQFGWKPKWLGHISSGGHLVSPNLKIDEKDGTLVVVKMTKLDKLTDGIDLGERPVMKIDVEGAEAEVFRGMSQLLRKKPDIILETLFNPQCALINEITKPLGYNYFFINEHDRNITQRDRLYPANPNSINLNQLLSTRSPESILSLSSQKK